VDNIVKAKMEEYFKSTVNDCRTLVEGEYLHINKDGVKEKHFLVLEPLIKLDPWGRVQQVKI